MSVCAFYVMSLPHFLHSNSTPPGVGFTSLERHLGLGHSFLVVGVKRGLGSSQFGSTRPPREISSFLTVKVIFSPVDDPVYPHFLPCWSEPRHVMLPLGSTKPRVPHLGQNINSRYRRGSIRIPALCPEHRDIFCFVKPS